MHRCCAPSWQGSEHAMTNWCRAVGLQRRADSEGHLGSTRLAHRGTNAPMYHRMGKNLQSPAYISVLGMHSSMGML